MDLLPPDVYYLVNRVLIINMFISFAYFFDKFVKVNIVVYWAQKFIDDNEVSEQELPKESQHSLKEQASSGYLMEKAYNDFMIFLYRTSEVIVRDQEFITEYFPFDGIMRLIVSIIVSYFGYIIWNIDPTYLTEKDVLVCWVILLDRVLLAFLLGIIMLKLYKFRIGYRNALEIKESILFLFFWVSICGNFIFSFGSILIMIFV